MGLGVSLRGTNPEPLTSVLGQKRTFHSVQLRSAIPPKADIDRHSPNVRFVPSADIPLKMPGSQQYRFESPKIIGYFGKHPRSY
jgi:hypothetical protein